MKTRIDHRFKRNPVVYGTDHKAIYLSPKGKRGDAVIAGQERAKRVYVTHLIPHNATLTHN